MLHETLWFFAKRCQFRLDLQSPLEGRIAPQATLHQLHIQCRFLRCAQEPPEIFSTATPVDLSSFQAKPVAGYFYLIDDSDNRVCTVNWSFAKATGSYYTNARSVQAIIDEWTPLQRYFTNVTAEEYDDVLKHLRLHRHIRFTIQFPRTFHLRQLILFAFNQQLTISMATSLSMDYLYYLLIHHFTLNIGTFVLLSGTQTLTKHHYCHALNNTNIRLELTNDGPQFTCPPQFFPASAFLFIHSPPDLSPISRSSSPVQVAMYQYLITGALGRNFVLLSEPTLTHLKQSLNAQYSARFRSQLRKIRYLAQQVLPNQPDTHHLRTT